MWVIMSIKPEYFNRILEGTKQVEIRSRAPREYIHAILWYVPYPVMRIKGLSIPEKNMDFESYEIKEGRKRVFNAIEEREIREVWDKVSAMKIGLSWEEFYEYASTKVRIFMIPLKRSYELKEIDPNMFAGWCYPRNFTYAPGSWIRNLYEMNVFQEYEDDLLVRKALGI